MGELIVNTEGQRTRDLSCGAVPSRVLKEILEIDFEVLLEAVAPKMPPVDFGNEGITGKMRLASAALRNHLSLVEFRTLQSHVSDTVRGLVIYGLAIDLETADIPTVLDTVRPFASDIHFGVREWAWLAVRPRLVRDLDQSIAALAPWTLERDPLLRRFAVEALRPRGVWCKAIADLRATPELGLPLLQPMRAEPEKYPQDSVANWLNDAAKDQPAWVENLCRSWLNQSDGDKNTARIVARGMRSIKEQLKT
ncbi:DNA alkylation repair protein [uncultured Celeribacter sp.]|uniref:DNA alkylation repair protein n=1 Tax=uncultured Celeribacter sp. TaxID=1303376 RepID=UPI002AA87416|nr:DNA alkylation repair protein [uncultured Celeribacter sp.]